MDILSIIPARKGSKRLKNKNFKKLNGKPLVYHTISCSLSSSYINKTIVSTDSIQYANKFIEYGAEVPFIRNENLSGDNIHSVEVIIDTLNWLKENKNYSPTLVVMLLPTSPLRKASTLDKAIEKFLKEEEKYDSLVSVCCLNKSIDHLRVVENNRLKFLNQDYSINIQSNDISKKIFSLNGSIYISTPNKLINNKTFHTENTTFYEMNDFESVDIDTIEDFKIAERLI